MLTVLTLMRFNYVNVSEDGRALISFSGENPRESVLMGTDDPYAMLSAFTKATESLQNQIAKLETEADDATEVDEEPEPEAPKPGHRLDAFTRSVDIEDVNRGDQIRIGGWWHRIAEINERRHGYTVKTTRNEWFAFDHGDRVTIATGGDND